MPDIVAVEVAAWVMGRILGEDSAGALATPDAAAGAVADGGVAEASGATDREAAGPKELPPPPVFWACDGADVGRTVGTFAAAIVIALL